MASLNKKLLSLLIFVFSAIILISWGFVGASKYEVVKPKRGKAVRAVFATGNVEPVYWAKVSASVAAQVTKILVDDGHKVKKGQVLANVEYGPESSVIEELNAKLEFLQKDKERQAKLAKRDVVSQKNYDNTLSEYNQTLARLKTQKEQIRKMTIISPIDGMVLRREIEPGEFVKQGDTAFWVGQPKPLRITAEVDEEDIPLVKLKQRALIKSDAFPEQVSEGLISDITPKGDPLNKNFRVRISLPENSPLYVGMTVEVNIIINEVDNATLVPASSVVDSKVYIKNFSGIIEKEVKTGIKGETNIQILEGIGDNDEILLKPSLYLINKKK